MLQSFYPPSFLSFLLHSNTSLLILLSNVQKQITNPARISPLIIIPRDEFDKVRVQLNTSLGIKDRRRIVSNEISGDILFVSVVDDALVRALGRSFNDGFDLVVRGALLKAHDEINDGDIEGGDTEGQAAERGEVSMIS